jgi:hypothetical protein
MTTKQYFRHAQFLPCGIEFRLQNFNYNVRDAVPAHSIRYNDIKHNSDIVTLKVGQVICRSIAGKKEYLSVIGFSRGVIWAIAMLEDVPFFTKIDQSELDKNVYYLCERKQNPDVIGCNKFDTDDQSLDDSIDNPCQPELPLPFKDDPKLCRQVLKALSIPKIPSPECIAETHATRRKIRSEMEEVAIIRFSKTWVKRNSHSSEMFLEQYDLYVEMYIRSLDPKKLIIEVPELIDRGEVSMKDRIYLHRFDDSDFIRLSRIPYHIPRTTDEPDNDSHRKTLPCFFCSGYRKKPTGLTFAKINSWKDMPLIISDHCVNELSTHEGKHGCCRGTYFFEYNDEINVRKEMTIWSIYHEVFADIFRLQMLDYAPFIALSFKNPAPLGLVIGNLIGEARGMIDNMTLKLRSRLSYKEWETFVHREVGFTSDSDSSYERKVLKFKHKVLKLFLDACKEILYTLLQAFQKVDFMEVFYVILDEYKLMRNEEPEEIKDIALQSLWNALHVFFLFSVGTGTKFLTLDVGPLQTDLETFSVPFIIRFLKQPDDQQSLSSTSTSTKSAKKRKKKNDKNTATSTKTMNKKKKKKDKKVNNI